MSVPFVGVFCEHKSLTKVPTFRNTSYRMSRPWTINLQENSISNIPENAFSNIQKYANGNSVSILLGWNDLGSGNISDSAFNGIEALISFVSLNRNYLQYIPSFVSNLPNLQGLNIKDNPISYIDPSFFCVSQNSENVGNFSRGFAHVATVNEQSFRTRNSSY